MTPKGVRASAAFLLLAALLLLPARATAQGVGFFQTATPTRTTCESITSPVTGRTWCFDTTLQGLRVYDGAKFATIASVNTYIINAKDFGAVGDGTTDDTAAIQRALNAAALSATVGVSVYLPAATYKLGSTLQMNASTTLYGDGMQATRLSYTGAGVAVNLLGGGSGGVYQPANTPWYTTIRDLAILSTTGTAAIKTSKVRNVYLRNIYAGGAVGASTGFSTACFWLSGDDTAQGGTQTSVVEGTWCQGGAGAGVLIDSQQSNMNVIRNNVITGLSGIAISATASVSNASNGLDITGNAITISGSFLIALSQMFGVNISGNDLETNNAKTIVYGAPTSPGVGGVSIIGNFFNGTPTSTIEMQSVASLLVAGNRQNGAVTNLVAATNPGGLVLYTIQGAQNATNTFRDGLAGTAYTATLVSDTLTMVGTTTGATVTTQRDDNPALVVQSVTGAGHYAEIDVNSGAVAGKWFSDPTYQSNTGAVILGTSSNHQTIVRSNNTDRLTLGAAGGVFVDAATGGSKGAGTVNASSYYVHGTAIASMPLTNASGTTTNAPHLVQDTVTLTGGTAGVALAGAAAFTSATTYTCVCDNDSAVLACRVVQNGGNGFTVSSGAGTDVVRFICAGS